MKLKATKLTRLLPLIRCICNKHLKLNWRLWRRGQSHIDDSTLILDSQNIYINIKLSSSKAVLPVLRRWCSRGCLHAVSAAVSSVSDRGIFRKQSCINASEEQEMKQRSHWNLPRGRHPGGEAGLVALRWELDRSPGVGCFFIFLQPRVPAVRRGAVWGRLAAFGEKDPSVVWDYF